MVNKELRAISNKGLHIWGKLDDTFKYDFKAYFPTLLMASFNETLISQRGSPKVNHLQRYLVTVDRELKYTRYTDELKTYILQKTFLNH